MNEADVAKIVKIHAGAVLIRGPEGEYVDTAANYTLDAGRPFPPLPGQAIGRTYIPNEKHSLYDGRKAAPERLPWAPGDQILTTLQTLLDNQVARKALAPDPGESIDALLLGALDALIEERHGEPNVPQAITDYIAARSG